MQKFETPQNGNTQMEMNWEWNRLGSFFFFLISIGSRLSQRSGVKAFLIVSSQMTETQERV